MSLPRQFEIPYDCMSCELKRGPDLCNFSQPLMNEFNQLGHLMLYPANAILLTEGQAPEVFTLPVPAGPSFR
jgi:hypothetical protein